MKWAAPSQQTTKTKNQNKKQFYLHVLPHEKTPPRGVGRATTKHARASFRCVFCVFLGECFECLITLLCDARKGTRGGQTLPDQFG